MTLDASTTSAAPLPAAQPERVRWGWFVACIALGAATIVAGWGLASVSGYFAGVLANVGTTFLLVGFVLLLERRIIGGAVRAVQRANARSDQALREQIKELEARLAAVWESATADDVAEKMAETTRLTDEFTKRVVDDATAES
jgi:hypothetical protein